MQDFCTRSDHYDGKRFFYPGHPFPHSLFTVLRWKLTSTPKPWPKRVMVEKDVPPNRVEKGLRVTFVGHASVLLQINGMNILTDPVFSDAIGPEYWPKIERTSEPGIDFEALPPIDLVLISHNHYDHLDLPTLEKLWQRDRPKIVAPLGNDRIIQRKHPEIEVATLDWEEPLKMNEGVEVYVEPALHWSARSLFDRNKALWASFVLKLPQGNILFVGDTGFGNGDIFDRLKAKFGSFLFAILPIGAYEPRWFMKFQHMNPEEACEAFIRLGSPPTLATHHSTFCLADEGYDDPAQDLARAQEKLDISKELFRQLLIGQFWHLQ